MQSSYLMHLFASKFETPGIASISDNLLGLQTMSHFTLACVAKRFAYKKGNKLEVGALILLVQL
jgi:hypothetical protein